MIKTIVQQSSINVASTAVVGYSTTAGHEAGDGDRPGDGGGAGAGAAAAAADGLHRPPPPPRVERH